MRSLFLLFVFSFCNIAQAYDLKQNEPLLLKSKHYNEYWDQYLVFEDGTLLTNQFLIGNYPFMTHKSFLISTLTLPDGSLYVIQNGRSRSNWSFDPDRLNIRMKDDIDHRLEGAFPDYKMSLHNTMAEVQLDLKATVEGIRLKNIKSGKKENMLIDIYAPHIKAQGKWRLGEEVGVPSGGPWTNFAPGEGFGMHVLIEGRFDKVLDNWLRIFGLGTGDRMVLSAVDGNKNAELFLYHDGKRIEGFEDIRLTTVQEKASDYGKNYEKIPEVIEISARHKDGFIKGTLTFSKKISHFRLSDHLGTFERMVSKAFPSIVRYRYFIEYDLDYTSKGVSYKISGKALGEYADIRPPTYSKKKRKRKR